MKFSMNFETFDTLLNTVRTLENYIKAVENLHGVQLDDSVLSVCALKIMDLLVDECEYCFDEESPIYDYAYVNNWGTTTTSHTIGGKEYLVCGTLSLYTYLKDRFEYLNNNHNT